jgi:hypothetical protein
MQSKPDLHSLTRAAYDEVQATASRSQRAKSPRGARASWTPAVWALLGVLLVYGLWHLGDLHLPSRKSTRAEADLESVLVQARDAVEAVRRAERALPDALPSASLAAVVRYERYVNDHHEESYRLSASSHGVTLLLDSDGNREVRKSKD